ncbi:MAG: Hsp70 family protein [Myxococcota bacterium]
MSPIGIDFGTTTTAVARREGMQVELLADSDGTDVFPSVIAYTPSGRVEIGKSARARRLIDPTNTLYSVKRIIGRSWLSAEVKEYRKEYPFELERGEAGLPVFVTRAGKFTAAQATTDLLKQLDETVDPGFSGDDQVSISVPSAFKPDQRAAVVEAAEAAGVNSVRLVDEPHAAALPYIDTLGFGKTIAVYDLGGGTFDLAVLKLGIDGFEVLAAGGDPYLGGDDIDLRCAHWAAERILETHRWDVRSSRRSFQSLLFACERAKIRLSDVDETLIPLGQVDQVLDRKDLRLERRQLESLLMDLVQRTFVVCDDVMSRSGVQARGIDAVILAGGGTFIPAVRKGVESYFGVEALDAVPPDRVVAIGAALATSG